MKIFLLFILFNCHHFYSFSQKQEIKQDTLKPKILDSVIVISFLKNGIPQSLPPVQRSYIFSGKKTIDLRLDESSANLAGNVARMAFAQIPGLNVWEMDGSGTQVNIGSRGTDTHRSIEMNMRQNGYNINSDIFGYPEDHYTPPMQAIQEVQLVRGSAALQFGSQFGGMMNYVMKEGDSSKPLAIESEQTGGSYNFFNSFNAIGGASGRWKYYAYYDNRMVMVGVPMQHSAIMHTMQTSVIISMIEVPLHSSFQEWTMCKR